MEESVRMWALIGMILIVLAAVIEIGSIISQTDPSATIKNILLVTMILLFGGVFLLDAAYLEWKQEVNYFITLGLVVTGIIGFSFSRIFHNAIVDAFFPRTQVPVFIVIDFLAIAIAGAFLPLFGRSLKLGDISDRIN